MVYDILTQKITQYTLISGAYNPEGLREKVIYKFDPKDETWSIDGSMEFERQIAAVDLVNYEQFSKHCQ